MADRLARFVLAFTKSRSTQNLQNAPEKTEKARGRADAMRLGRLFSYPDIHRDRIGANDLELPINRPKAEVASYNKDGSMRHRNPGDPVYVPDSRGGPKARIERGLETSSR